MKPTILSLTIILILLGLPGCAGQATPAPALPAAPLAAPQAAASSPPTATASPSPGGLASPQPPGAPAAVWVANPADHQVLRVDPGANQVTAAIPLDGAPETVIAGEGAVWALDRRNRRVFRIDPATNRWVTTIALPAGNPEDLAVGNGAVWVGMTAILDLNAQLPGPEEELDPSGFVVRIDPHDNRLQGRFPVQPVSRLVLNGSALWVLSRTLIETPVQVIDLNSNQGMAMPLHNAPEWFTAEALALNADTLWLFSSAYGKIFRATLDGQVNSAIDLEPHQPTGYADLLLAPSGLWAATPWGTVLRIDPRTNQIRAQLALQVPLTSLQEVDGAIWVLSQQAAMLFRIDPGTNQLSAQIPTGNLLEPTIVPTPTPRVVVWQPCPNSPSSRLKVGDLAYVTKDPPLPNRVRKEPNREAEVLGNINPGASMEILEGPVCANGWVWWKVKNADLSGWTAEGDRDTYWLVPLFN